MRYVVALPRSPKEYAAISAGVERLGGVVLQRGAKVEDSVDVVRRTWGAATHCVQWVKETPSFQDLACAVLGKWVVSREWIEGSIAAGRWLDEAAYGKRNTPLTLPPTAGLYITMKFLKREQRADHWARGVRNLFALAGGEPLSDLHEATHVLVSERDDADHYLTIPGRRIDGRAFTLKNLVRWLRTGGPSDDFAEPTYVPDAAHALTGLFEVQQFVPCQRPTRAVAEEGEALGKRRGNNEATPAKKKARGAMEKVRTAGRVPLGVLKTGNAPVPQGQPAPAPPGDAAAPTPPKLSLTPKAVAAPEFSPLRKEDAVARWRQETAPLAPVPMPVEVPEEDLTARCAPPTGAALRPIPALDASLGEPTLHEALHSSARELLPHLALEAFDAPKATPVPRKDAMNLSYDGLAPPPLTPATPMSLYDPCEYEHAGRTETAVVVGVLRGAYDIMFGRVGAPSTLRVPAAAVRARGEWTPSREESPAPRLPWG